MIWKILNRYTRSVMFKVEAETMREALEKKVRSGADLSNANLSGADLSNAKLSSAKLINADLSSANLINAKLIGADLSSADLSNANLSNAKLNSAKLIGAKLIGANLIGANLIGAKLIGTNLTNTKLIGLLRSNSVHTLLTVIDWGKLPDDLTLEMMRHDAESFGNKKMDIWVKTDICPFNDSVRDYLFIEDKALWVPGSPQYRGMALLQKLCKAKGYNLTEEKE